MEHNFPPLKIKTSDKTVIETCINCGIKSIRYITGTRGYIMNGGHLTYKAPECKPLQTKKKVEKFKREYKKELKHIPVNSTAMNPEIKPVERIVKVQNKPGHKFTILLKETDEAEYCKCSKCGIGIKYYKSSKRKGGGYFNIETGKILKYKDARCIDTLEIKHRAVNYSLKGIKHTGGHDEFLDSLKPKEEIITPQPGCVIKVNNKIIDNVIGVKGRDKKVDYMIVDDVITDDEFIDYRKDLSDYVDKIICPPVTKMELVTSNSTELINQEMEEKVEELMDSQEPVILTFEQPTEEEKRKIMDKIRKALDNKDDKDNKDNKDDKIFYENTLRQDTIITDCQRQIRELYFTLKNYIGTDKNVEVIEELGKLLYSEQFIKFKDLLDKY